jgi:hypothetical protein
MTLYDNMAHHTGPRYAVQTPPPACPQCGNHRTEVVDATESPRRMMIRCSACGMHSVIRGDRDTGVPKTTTDGAAKAAGAAADVAVSTDVSIELDVIQAVSLALAHLPDADAQRRVLRWINDRFPASRSTVDGPSAPKGPTGRNANLESLADLSLADLFEAPAFSPTATMHYEPIYPVQPARSSLARGLAACLQGVAFEWQSRTRQIGIAISR